MTTALLNVDLLSEDVTAFKAALVAHHIIPIASAELKVNNRKGYVTFIISVQGYWHTRLTEALHKSSAEVVAVLLPNGNRCTIGKATLLQWCQPYQLKVINLWGQPV